MLRELAKTSQHENVRAKVLELIQAWTFAFRNKTKYRALKVSFLNSFFKMLEAHGHLKYIFCTNI